jgi:hypothetical protein
LAAEAVLWLDPDGVQDVTLFGEVRSCLADISIEIPKYASRRGARNLLALRLEVIAKA